MDKSMTIKEVALIFNKDESTIRKIGKEIFPELFKNGIETRFKESHVTAIKLNLGKNSELPKTELEKKLIIFQAMQFLNEEIDILKSENKKLESTVKMLVHDFKKLYTSTEISKELNLKSAQQLNDILANKKIQYKQNGTWVLYSDYSDKNYTSIKETVLDSGKIVYDRLWTGAGRTFILDVFDSEVK